MDAEDNGTSEVTPAPSLWHRLARSVAGPGARTPPADADGASTLSDDERRRRIVRLDRRETLIGYLGALLALVMALAVEFPRVLNPKHALVPVNVLAGKNHTCGPGFKYTNVAHVGWRCAGNITYPASHWLTEMAIMLAFAAALFVAVLIGRRAPLGFVAILTGLAYQSQVGLLGLPFLAGGAWLLIRSWRTQRESLAGARSSKTADTPGTGGASSSRAKASKGTGSPSKPTASKRYTPKTPARKRPTPSK
jgi:hypothetical protein